MLDHGLPISREFIFSLLQGCIRKKDLAVCRQVHSLLINHGYESVAVLGDHLIRLFASCGSLLEANLKFCKVAKPSVFTWHSIISAHIAHGESERAIELYCKMQKEGIKPDTYTFTSVLKACANEGETEIGHLIHDRVIRHGLESDVVVGSSLLDMYAKCEGLNEARKIFDELLHRNVVSWNTMITGYSQRGYGLSALNLFENMQRQGIKPERVTFSSILKACGCIGSVDHGKLIHIIITSSGLELDVIIGSALVDMYAKCGNLEAARQVFDQLQERDVVSWGAMIAGYVQRGHGLPALALFTKLQHEGITPSKLVISCILKALVNLGSIAEARLIHHILITGGLESDLVLGSTLVDIYTKSGTLEDACRVFDNLATHDVVSWNALIGGYTHRGHGLIALQLFLEMQKDNVSPDRVTFLFILKACATIGALGRCKLIHACLIQGGHESDMAVGSALVDMYAKCGNMGEARKLFNSLPNQNVVVWGAMISGYAHHGKCSLVEQCLDDMCQQGLKPNNAIYTSILAACSHAGQLKECHQQFKSMITDHGIVPSIEHFNCMIDVFGRAGCLNEAQVLLQTMPSTPDITGWMSLLTSCRTYGNVETGRQCFDQLSQIEPDYASGYVLMSNLYSNVQMQEDFSQVQELRKGISALKKPGMAWVEVNNRVQEFIVGGKDCQQCSKINNESNKLRKILKKIGYVPQLDFVESALDEEYAVM